MSTGAAKVGSIERFLLMKRLKKMTGETSGTTEDLDLSLKFSRENAEDVGEDGMKGEDEVEERLQEEDEDEEVHDLAAEDFHGQSTITPRIRPTKRVTKTDSRSTLEVKEDQSTSVTPIRPQGVTTKRSHEIYITDLAYTVTEKDLREFCEMVGAVKDCRIVSHSDTGDSKGFGFVKFYDECTRWAALELLNEKELRGQKVCVRGERRKTQHAVVTNLPQCWSSLEDEELCTNVQAVAEKFGELAEPPEILEGGQKVHVEFIGHPLSVKASTLFTVKLEKSSCEDKLGLHLDKTNAKALPVVSVGQGLVSAYNAGANPEKQIAPGDRIIAINSIRRDSHAMVIAAAESMRLTLAVERPNPKATVEVDGSVIEITPSRGDWKKIDRTAKGLDFSRSVYVKHLHYDSSEEDLRRILEQVGPVERMTIVKDRQTQKSKGFAFCQYATREASQEAVTVLSGIELDGRFLVIQPRTHLNEPGRICSRSRSRSRSRSAPRDKPQPEEELQIFALHLDELGMPSRPVLEPSLSDREVWVDLLPDDTEAWGSEFGAMLEVFRIEDAATGRLGDRGYVVFESHESAKRCVESGSASWSESERFITSMRSHRRDTAPSYPHSNMVSLLSGFEDSHIDTIRTKLGMSSLRLCGDGVFQSCFRHESSRLHFVCMCKSEIIEKVQPALEDILGHAHRHALDLMKKRGTTFASGKPGAWAERSRSRSSCTRRAREYRVATDNESGTLKSGFSGGAPQELLADIQERHPPLPPPPLPPPSSSSFTSTCSSLIGTSVSHMDVARPRPSAAPSLSMGQMHHQPTPPPKASSFTPKRPATIPPRHLLEPPPGRW